MDTMVRRAPLQETWGFGAATSVLCAPVGLQGRTSGKRWGVGASPRLTGALPLNRSYRKSACMSGLVATNWYERLWGNITAGLRSNPRCL